ncbi:MAG TPA: RNA polymerase sigma factor [Candidatus Eisenbacteria bacterium]|nr:RNA polymerase sigma factor [Candidatus Eisenbacteria bacterium]
MIANPMCEKDAIRCAQNGDQAGLAKLYELHRSRVYGLCLRHTKNSFDAEDLTHDVFLQVSRKISTFRGEAEFSSWLYKVSLNVVRLHARRQRHDERFVVVGEPEESLQLVHGRQSNPAQSLALKQALSRLTALRRQAVVLHDIEGFTHNEIAWRMSATEIASKSRLHRAHVVLREILSKSAQYPFHARRTVNGNQEQIAI